MFLAKGFFLSLLLVMLLSGIFLGGQALAKTEEISIVDFAFAPALDTVSVNDSVRWTNNGATAHSSTSNTGIWDSGTLNPGQSYTRQFTAVGTFNYLCTFHPFMQGVIVVRSTGVEDGAPANAPSRFSLNQNFPNPFNSSTGIAFYLPRRGPVTLKVYNVLGQKIRTLLEKEEEAGSKTVFWDGTDDKGLSAPTGIYFYRLTAQDFGDTKKMVYLK